MNYYTSTIPLPLAEKLKEKGMPMEVWNRTVQGIPYICTMEKSSFDWLDKELGNTPSEVEARYSIPTFGACFDWLTEKGIYVGITRTFARWGWLLFQDHAILQAHYETWHEAADAAIEKALTLI